MQFVEELPVLCFFFERLEPVGDWGAQLAAAFRADFGDEF